MVCPHCQANNPDDSPRCQVCGYGLPGFDKGGTPKAQGAAAPETSPVPLKASTSIEAPPAIPISSSQTPTSGGSWPSPAGGSAALEPGANFGPRYRIDSVLGKGGMGTVYKAYDKHLNRLVALKLVRPELSADPAAVQRFKQELLLASRISHKNILRIHDLGEVGATQFISMACIEGEDLHHLLQKQGRLPADRAVSMARQLCAGLAAAHAEGVVHRDLKPQNVLIDQAGNVYISDFGLAKSLEAGAATMTHSGQFLGTPRYMSPEQVEGKPADHRSDIYSLGLILYEMVAGDVPFKGDSAQQIMFKRLKEKPQNPRLLNPDLPEYLARIIMRCLETDPGRRYRGVGEILADLDAQRATSQSRLAQIALPVPTRRNRLLIAGTFLILLLLAFVIPSSRNIILRRPAAAPTASATLPTLAEGKYLAILPFRVLGDQASLGYIAEGVVEALTAKLFQLKGVHIASMEAVEKAIKQKSLERIAHDLGVNLVIEGTLQEAGGRIAIIVNLKDASSSRLMWAQEFSGAPQDLLALEDQIYSKLVDALELKPSNEELARGARHPTENFSAYDLYLKGREAMRGEEDAKRTQMAVDLYEAALKKDPNFALAYAGLADACLGMYRTTKDDFWAHKALGAAQQAQRLNDKLAEVHFSLGSVYNATGKVAESIAELRRALQLAPDSDGGYRRLGYAYLAGGRKEEALQAFQKAIDLNPYYWANYNSLGYAYFQVGENEKALSAYRRVTELEPDNSTGYENIGNVYFRQGKYDDCVPVIKKAIELSPRYDNYSNLGTTYFYLKRYDEAVGMFEKAVQTNPNQEWVVGNLADAYRWSGHPEKARTTYDQAIALGYKELQINPRNAEVMADMALYYAKKGNPTEALGLIRRARSIDGNNVYFIHTQGVVEAIAGRPEEAVKTLREAFRKGIPPDDAMNDPELKDLRSRPEFQKLAKEFSGKPR
jgi:tetratricopeptide (TPR) repeat protein